LVLISIVISLPLTYLLISRWLEDFSSRVSISPFLFVVPSLLLALIAFLTIAYHTYRTVTLNPVTSLRED
ncbi:MAG: hypothetical protein WBA74_06715, partial [Cyclobacteriaceae bacterium]